MGVQINPTRQDRKIRNLTLDQEWLHLRTVLPIFLGFNMSAVPQDQEKVRDALRAIIEGKIVKRSRHDLHHDGRDLGPLFIEELEKRGYGKTTVDALDVKPGERVPAFFIENEFANFGWVFWERFTSWKIRKLWGSVIKNKKGDWDIQIPAGRAMPIYANARLKIEMDIDHPPEF